MSEPIASREVPAEARAHLRAADPVLAPVLDRIGTLQFRTDPDVWASIVGAIVGQQLSTRAAATIRGRVAALGGDRFPPPDLILVTPDEDLRACGLSRAKLTYVRDAAERWTAGEIRPEELVQLSDDEIIERLVRIRGVGRWTAEMVLIFCLERPDVLAVDDLGIRSAVQKLYGLADRPGREELMLLGERWKPYRTYASLYLWRSLASPAEA
jgi:DNA-3-methyladenine glycosylase II